MAMVLGQINTSLDYVLAPPYGLLSVFALDFLIGAHNVLGQVLWQPLHCKRLSQKRHEEGTWPAIPDQVQLSRDRRCLYFGTGKWSRVTCSDSEFLVWGWSKITDLGMWWHLSSEIPSVHLGNSILGGWQFFPLVRLPWHWAAATARWISQGFACRNGEREHKTNC